MRTKECKLTKSLPCLTVVMREVEQTVDANELAGKDALHLRLLAEELCGMLQELVENFDGEFWIENTGKEFSLHTRLYSATIDAITKESLLTLSSSGENAAAKGITGKIRDVVENLLLNEVRDADFSHAYGADISQSGNSPAQKLLQNYSWSLYQYKTAWEKRGDASAVEALRRSIIANLADDVTVGIRGKTVEMVVSKKF